MDAESKIRIAISSALSAKGFDDATASTEKLKQKAKEASRGIGSINDSLDVLKSRAESVVQPLHTVQGIFAAYGVGTAVKSLIDINAQFESMQTGISALIAVNAQNVTSMGREISAQEKFTLAQRESANVVELLRKANISTPATLAELTDGFQSAVGPALKLNWSLEQTVKYTTLMTQAAAAMGMPMNQLAQEMRSVLSGQIDMNSQVARNLGITNEQITEHIKLGDTYSFLMSKLQDFEAAGAQMATNWEGVTSNLTDNFDSVKKKAGENLFGALKTDLNELNTLLGKNSDQIAGEFSDGLMTAYNAGKTLAGGLYEMRGIIDNVIVGYAAFKVGGMIATGITTATSAIVSMNAALKTATVAQLAFNAAAKLNPYILGATVLGSLAYATYENSREMIDAQAEADKKYWEDIGKENTEKAKSQEGMLKTAEAYEQKYQEIFAKTGQRIEAYKTQAEQLRKMAASVGGNMQENLMFGEDGNLPDRFSRSSDADKTYWEKRYDLDKNEYDKSLQLAKKTEQDRKKNEEDYYDYIADLSKTSTQDKVDQEILSEAYKYQKFLDEHKLSLEQKEALERAFTGAIERIQLDGQKESLKKQEDALLEYYKAIGNTTKAAEIELKRYKESLNDVKDLTPLQRAEMIAAKETEIERKRLVEQLELNEEYYTAIGDKANAAVIAQEKYFNNLLLKGKSVQEATEMAYGQGTKNSNYDTMYSSVGLDTGLAGQLADRLKAVETFQSAERSRIQAHYALLEQDEQTHAAKMAELSQMEFQSKLATAGAGFGSLASLAKAFYDASDGQNKTALRAYQAFSVVQAMISTYTAAASAYEKGVTLGGPPLGAAFAAVAVAQGMAQVAMIKAQKFHTGGFVTGATDEVPAILQRGEGVLSRKGMENLDALNIGKQSSQSASPQITIVNSIDPSIMEQYVTSRSGRKVIKNIINGS